MSKIEYKIIKVFNDEDIEYIYKDAGWSNYTNDIPMLISAFENSLYVYGAYEDNKLVGLVRVVGDGLTIIYIQDLLVLKSYQRQGIATKLLQNILEKYKSVRQICLMSDNDNDLIQFYNFNNFIEVHKLNAESYLYYKK